ncbi:MAG: leucine-rich repeat domain-containing protein [Lachnospiraceae bacterium]|nr:leucine-rich repeat domain-containing protein [Lachnospiraceae bacterium]
MKQFDYKIEDNTYICEINEQIGGIEILAFRGTKARLELPEKILYEGREWELCAIGKKAFLGCRGLRSVVLPASVKEIRDWAFSQCGQLEGVQILEKGSVKESNPHICFGNGVFADCPNIRYIAVGVEKTDDVAVLLAATVNQVPAEDLLRDAESGSEHWFGKWDQRLFSFINEDDAEGYTNMVLCGEEDIVRNVPEFMEDKRRRKAGLCMLRLMHDRLLPQNMRQFFTEYLLTHTKGCESEEAWEVIVLEHGEDLSYYQLLAELGGVTADNIDAMVQDLDTSHAEAKAFLIRYKQEHFAVADVFDLFTL